MSEVRKRISRACDSCNALRTKCDGQQPCQHCVEIDICCEFNRTRKKRGKAAKKDQELVSELGSQPYRTTSDRSVHNPVSHPLAQFSDPQRQEQARPTHSTKIPATQEWAQNLPSPMGLPFDVNSHNDHPYQITGQTPSPIGAQFANLPSNGQTNPARYSQNAFTRFPAGPGPHLDHPFSLPPPVSRPLSITGSELNNLNKLFGPTQSPRPDALNSPKFDIAEGMFKRPPTSNASDDRQLKYQILIPHVRALDFIPSQVLCELLDTYFDNSPYVIGYVIRRCSIVHKIQPRKTSTALIYAMLCVAAHTCEHSFFSSSPVARAKTVQRLFEMSVSALRPLQHDQVDGGALDDVITYIQLGAIIAASEFKGVSLRWFHAAWTLAKELHLNRELPDSPEGLTTTETTKEERRRTWWLLYIVDRHLGLCYNKPLVFADVECLHLYHPLDEDRWASNEDIDILYDSRSINSRSSYGFDYSRHPLYEGRARGPNFTIQGRGIFGFFLPLMVILGEICTLVMMQRTCSIVFDNLDHAKRQVQQHLAQYEQSLDHFRDAELRANNNNNNKSLGEERFRYSRRYAESAVLPYARQLMHTMYILLSGKWDPILLMEDEDGWISSKEFVAAATHAVAAAESTTEILRIDPDLTFMPFFFGIYLLQGSFLLLLIVDKLEQSADEAVVHAAETYIRAHEVCVVTLDTQYQRNFRKVMRSTLNGIRQHRRATDEEKSRRREILSLYRWHEDGRGLVI